MCQAETVLEIGPGPGLVTTALRREGIKVTTCDIAEDVNPDVCASVLDMPFKDGSFDCVLCCQVLEHIPFDKFDAAIREITRVCRRGAIISLPHAGPFLAIALNIPRLGRFGFGFSVPRFPAAHTFDGQHHWEIGKRGYSLAEIIKRVKKDMDVERHYRPVENPYHHFFVCAKPANKE